MASDLDRARGLLHGLAYGERSAREAGRVVPGARPLGLALVAIEALRRGLAGGPEGLVAAYARSLAAWAREPAVAGAETTAAVAARRIAEDVRLGEARVSWSKEADGVVVGLVVGFACAPSPALACSAASLCSGLTHGHPTAHAAAVAAALVALASPGAPGAPVVPPELARVARGRPWGETLAALERVDGCAAISDLGEGWNAEEALAMALWAVRRSPGSVEGAVRSALDHDGDAASVAALAGGIAGLLAGSGAVPAPLPATDEPAVSAAAAALCEVRREVGREVAR